MIVAVTGAQGFLGRRIVDMLLERGHRVRALVRRPAPELACRGLEVRPVDLRRTAEVDEALVGAAGIIHCAAKSGVWGPYDDFTQTNLIGTVNILAGARRAGAGWIVYTSSPSVVHTGRPLEGVDEEAPYLTDFTLAYPYTKMLAEKLILTASCRDLRTIALRPHLIWGPGDPHFLPRLLDRAAKNRLWLFKGRALVDATYVDNAAWAHILAAEALAEERDLGGRAFFIGQGEPLMVDELVNRLLAAAAPGRGFKVRGLLSPFVGRLAATLLEGLWSRIGLSGEPPLTRFVVEELTLPHWFNLERARRDLGYSPLLSMAQGLERLARSSQAPD